MYYRFIGYINYMISLYAMIVYKNTCLYTDYKFICYINYT